MLVSGRIFFHPIALIRQSFERYSILSKSSQMVGEYPGKCPGEYPGECPGECPGEYPGKFGSFMETKDHFTVVCLVAWPLSESEAGVDFVLIQTFLLFMLIMLVSTT